MQEKQTLVSMFEANRQALENELKGLSLPKDANKIQSIVTNYFGSLFDQDGSYRQSLTVSEDYILQGKMADGVFPTSEMCALNLGLSVQYFKDLLQFYSGKALREYVELKRIGLAKNMLMKCDYSVSRIVTELGYPSVRQFNMLFKRLTGFLPQDYKVAQN